MSNLIPAEVIAAKILIIRGKRVILDRDLAKLYEVDTSQLTRQVKRNIDRFPEDFMFQLTKEEVKNLMCQFGISSWGGTRKLPYAFTEQGIAMLSGVLYSKRAIQVNIQIMRAFIQLKKRRK
ncbi:MAG: ORF6N domain-containing protein [Candidatus Omnitrophota bacterium]